MTLKDLKKKIRKEFEGSISRDSLDGFEEWLDKAIEEACKEAFEAVEPGDGWITVKHTRGPTDENGQGEWTTQVKAINDEFNTKKDKFLNN